MWRSLVLRLAGAEGQPPGDLPSEVDAKAKQMLFRLLDEFLELTGEHDGIHRIYVAYHGWRGERAEHGCRATDEPVCPQVDWPRATSYRS